MKPVKNVDNVVLIVHYLSYLIKLAFASYLRHLEELGLETCDDILDGVLETILLRAEG